MTIVAVQRPRRARFCTQNTLFELIADCWTTEHLLAAFFTKSLTVRVAPDGDEPFCFATMS